MLEHERFPTAEILSIDGGQHIAGAMYVRVQYYRYPAPTQNKEPEHV